LRHIGKSTGKCAQTGLVSARTAGNPTADRYVTGDYKEEARENKTGYIFDLFIHLFSTKNICRKIIKNTDTDKKKSTNFSNLPEFFS
jgi:hypothetical protein